MNRPSRKFYPQEVERTASEFREDQAENREPLTNSKPVEAQIHSGQKEKITAIATPLAEEVPLEQPNPERIEKIGTNFKGLLSEQDRIDLKALPARQIFKLLTSDPANIHAAIHYMNYFPSQEAVALLLELIQDGDHKADRITILWVLNGFTFYPECSQQAIKALKELKDPRAIYTYEKGTIEAATVEQIEEIMTIAPSSVVNKQYLLEKTNSGSVFFLKDTKGEMATFAIAIKFPEQYLLLLHYIYTDPGHREQGYAEDMMQYLLKEHVGLTCELYRGDMLSEKVLKKLGFARVEGMGDKWIFRNIPV